MRLLEVGCGSGVYLRHAAEANPELTGVAIDMQADVVDQARANLSRWGFSDRFSVSVADIRRPTADLDGPFDVITLYNNIYYFQVEERVPLLRSLRSRLAPDGKLALVSFMKDRTSRTSSLNFDVFLRSTSGCGPLPGLKELIDQLRESGFSEVSTAQLLPREALYGIVAKSGAQYSRHDNDT